jgi:hypothetical protein
VLGPTARVSPPHGDFDQRRRSVGRLGRIVGVRGRRRRRRRRRDRLPARLLVRPRPVLGGSALGLLATARGRREEQREEQRD